jgi:hypothetical protein
MATVSIHVPMFDTNAPDHRRAYAGWRNGARETIGTARATLMAPQGVARAMLCVGSR